MQELKVVQRIGRRYRAFRPASTLPAPASPWRSVARPPFRQDTRSRGTSFSPRPTRVPAVPATPSEKSRGILVALLLGGVAALSAVSYLVAVTLQPVVPFAGAQSDPLARRAMLSYVGVRSALPSTELEAGDGSMLDTVETFSWETYTVKAGDSVSGIALSRSLSLDSVIALNGLTNVKRLRAGSVIRIPNMDGIPYTVRKGDSLSRIAASWGIPVEAILDANDLASDTIAAGQVLFLPGARMRGDELKMALGELFIYPMRGRLSSTFGWRNDPFTGARRFHAAIDLASKIGTPVRAAMDGRVAAVGVNSVYGNYVIVSHSGGFQTMYAHLNVVRTTKGSRVSQGERIGDVGTSGYSTGPHLHFGVYRNGRAVDPLQFLGR